MKNSNSRKGGCLFNIIAWASILLIVLCLIFYFFGESLISKAITQAGKKADVDMGGNVSMNLLNQEVGIKNFYIENPQPGYSKENAISFKEIFVRTNLSVAAIKKQAPVEIDEIRIINPQVRLEKDGNATILEIFDKNNVKEIQNRFAAFSSKEKQEKPKAEAKAEAEGYKLRINKVIFEEGKLIFSYKGKDVSVPIPSFTIEGIGSQEGGATTAEAVVDIITNFTMQAIGSSSAARQELMKELKGTFDDFKHAAKDFSKEAVDAFKSLLK